MVLPGTQMDIVTFIFVSIEIVIFFYLAIYKLSRPDDKTTSLNLILITLLITYNITGGLLPDPSLPGSEFLQEVIAYGTGFITPCYFPYYVLKVFGLEKMKFHAKKGVFIFLFFPYLIFICVYRWTGSLDIAKDLLVLPVLYAVWIIYSLVQAINHKYRTSTDHKRSKEADLLLLSIAPWIGLPFVAYFDLSQASEACITNGGFLLLFGLQVSRHIRQLRIEHLRLEQTEHRLLNWNSRLHEEVNKRTRELEKIIEQRTNTFVTLAHETKTPLTLIHNYLEEYISKNGISEELMVVKTSLSKLSRDIINLFDVERFNKGVKIYNHGQVTDFSGVMVEEIVLFRQYALKKDIKIDSEVESGVRIKADPVAVSRLINNLVENALKFSPRPGEIMVSLMKRDGKIHFSVADNGPGIPSEFRDKIFQPYFQMALHKKENQGMGLGLAIVKKIIADLEGTIEVVNNPGQQAGTMINVILHPYSAQQDAVVSEVREPAIFYPESSTFSYAEQQFDETRATILLLEDNVHMAGYLVKKLQAFFNIYPVKNGHEGLQKLKDIPVLPDLIISDVMMDHLDGYHFARILSRDPALSHIPLIFLSARSSGKDKIEGLRAGAVDFIAKPFLIEELIRKAEAILRIVSRQRSIFLKASLQSLERRNEQNAGWEDSFYDRCRNFHLSSREMDIVKRIIRGSKYREIGEALFISEKTVSKHVQNIFAKVEVNSKVGLINKLQSVSVSS